MFKHVCNSNSLSRWKRPWTKQQTKVLKQSTLFFKYVFRPKCDLVVCPKLFVIVCQKLFASWSIDWYRKIKLSEYVFFLIATNFVPWFGCLEWAALLLTCLLLVLSRSNAREWYWTFASFFLFHLNLTFYSKWWKKCFVSNYSNSFDFSCFPKVIIAGFGEMVGIGDKCFRWHWSDLDYFRKRYFSIIFN